jgi:16S rRNA (guanine966-N2)-methyltransferase
MGIEALSRGADSVLFADDNKAALAALEKNIKICSLENRAKSIKWNIFNNLNIIRSYTPAFNLIFLDPPYNKNMIQPTLSNLDISRCLENPSQLTIEHSPKERIPKNLTRFKISDQRRYGKTLVSFLIYMV